MRKKDVVKLQLLKYLISVDGRDIYSMLKFDKEEKDRMLNEVLDDIDDQLLYLFVRYRIVYRIIDFQFRKGLLKNIEFILDKCIYFCRVVEIIKQ